MPFTTDNAKDMVSKRWKNVPKTKGRTVGVHLKFTADEIQAINEKAKQLGMTRPNLIIYAVAAYNPQS